MFPDPSLEWRPYPSIIDGIERPPFVYDQGLWRGVLHLVVMAATARRAYGIEIGCDVYAAVEEMVYSIAEHGGRSGTYDGGVYIKVAASSALLRTYADIGVHSATPQHFSFVGGDYCYEVLSFSEPKIFEFDDPQAAFGWGPDRV